MASDKWWEEAVECGKQEGEQIVGEQIVGVDRLSNDDRSALVSRLAALLRQQIRSGYVAADAKEPKE